MKKIISILLILVLALAAAGCSEKKASQKTEEELRAEIKAELEKEAKEESEKEGNKETKNEVEKKDQVILVKGKITNPGIPMGIGILLGEEMKIDNRTVNKVFFDEDNITDFVPRKYFTYYFEGGTSIKEEFNNKIPIEIEVDSDSFDYYDELDRTSAKLVKIVSLDGETNPGDKTKDEYPLDYYKSVFYTYVYQNNSPCVADIKEHYFYKNTDEPNVGDIFKTAVDKILENGFFIQMAEGEYMINETEKKYSDGEIQAPTVFNIEDLKNGDTISGDMIIDDIEYSKGADKVKFSLKGETLVVGNITYSDYFEGYILTVDDPYLFNSIIKITLSENIILNYKPKVLSIRNDNFISNEDKEALKQGKKLRGKITIKDIIFSAKAESESSESCQIKDFLDVSVID